MKYALALVAVLTAFFLLLPEPLPEPDAPAGLPSKRFIIRDVQLFDGEQTFSGQDVLVVDGQVQQIGRRLSVEDIVEVDGKGKTLLPGLIDAHTHVWGEALQEAINFGVTTELDMFSMPHTVNPLQKQRSDPANIVAADLFSATILVTAPDGHGTEYGFEIPVLTEVSQAAGFVEARIRQGADYIKIVYDAPDSPYQFSPSISKEVMVEVVKQAHLQGKMAVVHVDNLQSAKEVISAGADGLIHSFMDAVADDELITLMQQNKAFVIATLAVEASLAKIMPGEALYGDPSLAPYINAGQLARLKAPFIDLGFEPAHYQNARQSIYKFNQAEITILAGSDAPNPGTAHGVSLHHELALLVDAGLTPLQALAAATGNTNKVFDIGYRGTIKQDQSATFVLVEGDPTKHIEHSRNIVGIWKHGSLVERVKAEPGVAVGSDAQYGLIADFGQESIAPLWGAGLQATTDAVAGGKSSVALLKDPKGFLQVTGEVRPGFAYPWAGVTFNMGKPYNLSDFGQLHFRARGNMQTLYIMLFQKGNYQPIIQTVTLDKPWRDYSIELAGFANADLANVTQIAWVASQTPQTFDFAIDDIGLK